MVKGVGCQILSLGLRVGMEFRGSYRASEGFHCLEEARHESNRELQALLLFRVSGLGWVKI